MNNEQGDQGRDVAPPLPFDVSVKAPMPDLERDNPITPNHKHANKTPSRRSGPRITPLKSMRAKQRTTRSERSISVGPMIRGLSHEGTGGEEQQRRQSSRSSPRIPSSPLKTPRGLGTGSKRNNAARRSTKTQISSPEINVANGAPEVMADVVPARKEKFAQKSRHSIGTTLTSSFSRRQPRGTTASRLSSAAPSRLTQQTTSAANRRENTLGKSTAHHGRRSTYDGSRASRQEKESPSPRRPPAQQRTGAQSRGDSPSRPRLTRRPENVLRQLQTRFPRSGPRPSRVRPTAGAANKNAQKKQDVKQRQSLGRKAAAIAARAAARARPNSGSNNSLSNDDIVTDKLDPVEQQQPTNQPKQDNREFGQNEVILDTSGKQLDPLEPLGNRPDAITNVLHQALKEASETAQGALLDDDADADAEKETETRTRTWQRQSGELDDRATVESTEPHPIEGKGHSTESNADCSEENSHNKPAGALDGDKSNQQTSRGVLDQEDDDDSGDEGDSGEGLARVKVSPDTDSLPVAAVVPETNFEKPDSGSVSKERKNERKVDATAIFRGIEDLPPLHAPHIARLDHTEPDTARQGNDYEYFLNVICRDPRRSKEYFDVQANDITDLYELREDIGSGGYSTVHRSIHKETRKEYAIKLVSLDVFLQHRTRMEAEAAVLGSVGHPAIVKFHGIVRTRKHFCFVMELLLGGELFDRIIERKYGYAEPQACRLITTILEAVEHLHANGVVHRDIKPENFLFDNPDGDPDGGMLKLIDFGFATFQNPVCRMLGSSCGTPDYIAPELLLEKPHDQAVDIWSCGVVLYILLCGFPPFYADNDDQLFDLIAEGAYDFPSPQWDNISPEARDLVTHMLQVNPSNRWTATKALSHSWVVRNNLINSQQLLDKRMRNLTLT